MSKASRRARLERRKMRDIIPPPSPIQIPPDPPGTPHTETVGIPLPPDNIFKRKRDRIMPSQDIWGIGTITYIPIRAEYIKGKGNFVYYQGVSIPSKTVALAPAVYAVNGMKRMIMEDIRLLSKKQSRFLLAGLAIIGKKRRGEFLNEYCARINSIGEIIVLPFYLEDDYYCSIVKEIIIFVKTFLIELGVDDLVASKTSEIIGMMFEYDNAYRFRVTDMMNESIKDSFLENFPKELERLIRIGSSREVLDKSVSIRFNLALHLIKYAWYVPQFKKALRTAISAVNFDNCRLDEMDIYHTLLYGDYNVRGKTLEERFQIYADIHGPDMEKWPPRIIIRNRTSWD